MREAVRDEVLKIVPLDSLENQTRKEVLSWIDSGCEIFRLEKPATPPKHLVSYFVVVDGAYLLLVDHINAGLWLPTGGHVEPNEHPKDTVIREAREELGLELEFLFPDPLLVTSTETVGKTAGHTDVSLWYALQGDRAVDYAYDTSEFRSVNWFHQEEAPFEQSDPEISRFIQKLRIASA